MAFKPNYGQQCQDRQRAKEQKKQEKLQKKQEAAEQRRAERDGLPAGDDIPDTTPAGAYPENYLMARMNRSADQRSPALFNVIYEDGSLSSNRKVPADMLNGFDDIAAARAFLEAQDRDIAEKSGRMRGRIRTLTRLSRR